MENFLGRGGKILLISALLVGGTAGVAAARTGYDKNPRSIVFYFGETAGHGDSQDFSGYGAVKLCTDGDNSGGNSSYGAQYYHNRFMYPDEILKEAYPSYNSPAYHSGNFTTSSGADYHTHADWSAVTSAPNSASGFSATRTASLSCP